MLADTLGECSIQQAGGNMTLLVITQRPVRLKECNENRNAENRSNTVAVSTATIITPDTTWTHIIAVHETSPLTSTHSKRYTLAYDGVVQAADSVTTGNWVRRGPGHEINSKLSRAGSRAGREMCVEGLMCQSYRWNIPGSDSVRPHTSEQIKPAKSPFPFHSKQIELTLTAPRVCVLFRRRNLLTVLRYQSSHTKARNKLRATTQNVAQFYVPQITVYGTLTKHRTSSSQCVCQNNKQTIQVSVDDMTVVVNHLTIEHHNQAGTGNRYTKATPSPPAAVPQVIYIQIRRASGHN
ncbi:hypothetical protein CBL_03494 [Carabus blaptoides fortunei]